MNSQSGTGSLAEAPQLIPIRLLKPADSPRIEGENPEHVQALAEISVGLPPILVHQRTMRVIDGMHRLRAAMLRGEDEIEAVFFDGSDVTAFCMAVNANITHGLPLTLAERKAAAMRIIESCPLWADRAIASTTGLAVRTVRTLRKLSDPQGVQGDHRIGADGRVRPLDTTAGRIRAGQLLEEEPTLSVRALARQAGISVGTAKNVLDRVRNGQSPVLERNQADAGGPGPQDSASSESPYLAQSPGRDLAALLAALCSDPSLRLTDSGRNVLRLLLRKSLNDAELPDLPDLIPAHAHSTVADLARLNAIAWARLAELFEQRSNRAAQIRQRARFPEVSGSTSSGRSLRSRPLGAQRT